jgi:anti-sigma regulatory factor (Ser/Thr protein kinase)
VGPTTETPGDEIRLTLPARHDHGRLARVMVSRLAVRHGFRPREVEDLRIATDEAIIVLLGGWSTPDAATGSLTVRTQLQGASFSVEVTAPGTEPPDADGLARFRELVQDLVDGMEVDTASRTVRFRRDRS